jgi:hypothetical protein
MTASSFSARSTLNGGDTVPLFPLVLLHLSRLRCSADRLRLNPRHAASPPDNDDLPGEFRRQHVHLLLNPLSQVHAGKPVVVAAICLLDCFLTPALLLHAELHVRLPVLAHNTRGLLCVSQLGFLEAHRFVLSQAW